MHVHTYVWPRDGVEKERMVFRQMSEGIFTQFPSLLFRYKTKFPNAPLAHTRTRLLLGSHGLGFLLTHLWSWGANDAECRSEMPNGKSGEGKARRGRLLQPI